MIDEIIQNDLDEIKNRVHDARGFFDGKTFLVTGGAGFLGSWICDILLKIGAKVICQDNYSSGLHSNIDHLIDKKQFKFVNDDIRENVPKEKIDGIFHLAGRASPEDYNLHQVETLLTNSEGIKKVLELANENNCVCLYSSTSEIYGDAKIIPTPESYWGNVNSIGERSCYDEGKRYGEALCMAFFREYNTNVKIVRIFNTYGPRIRPDGPYGRALSRFVLNALNGENISIYGDGEQTRSFSYVSDTITGILLFMSSKTQEIIFNIGNEKELTIKQLANSIVQKINSKTKIVHLEKMPDDPRRRRPEISKAEKILGWKPEIPFEVGLEKTIQWMLKNKDNYS